ncbi:hypothetical protein DYQ86_07955 [Acidobacteria bacterium AB60]|nr:hypothetical protein DYQ86_07955 [Acidobacteria bacterium AB60]
MSRYILIRRLRGPAFLLLVGIIALLHQADVLSWGHAWPLFLILAGVLLLAERAALASEGYPPYPGAMPGQYPASPYAPPAGEPVPPASTSTSIVPATQDDYERRGGQS